MILGRSEESCPVPVCLLNLGQLVRLVRQEYLIDAKPLSKVQGQPFRTTEIRARIDEMLA